MKKNLLIALLVIGLISVSFHSFKGNQKEPIIASRKITQVAVVVKDIDRVEKEFALINMPTIQRGGWDGGAYSYIDGSKDLGCILERLENFK